MTSPAISYYLKSEIAGDVKVRIYDGGRLIAEMDGAKSAGVHTVRWNLQARRERVAGEPVPAGGRGGGRGGFAGAQGCDPNSVCAPARTGEYRVVLTVGGRELSQTARILTDPSAR